MKQPGARWETLSLGATDVQVEPLGIGAWQWGDRMMWGFGRDYGEAEVRLAFEASLAASVRFFDTAEIYGRGRSERFVGEFVRASSQPVVVATKYFPFPWRWRKRSLVEALRRSLDRLGLQQVDLYHIHWPFPPRSVAWWADSLADAVEAGLARAVGVSNFSVDQTRRAHDALARRGVPLASNQVEYSLLHRQPERNGLLGACRELNITLVAYSPLAKGLLTGKYTPLAPPPGLRRRRWHGERLARIQPLITRLRELGQAHGGKTPAQVALNWLMRKGALPIPGVKNARQVQDNAGALGWSLTSDEVAMLDEVSDDVS